MTKRRALGRGLEALIPDKKEEEGPLYCNILDISPSSIQPRKVFNDKRLNELTNSVKEKGVIQPLIVRRSNGRYELIAGERRWRAAKRAGITKVPIVLLDATDRESLELAVVENIQREDLNPIEEAEAFKRFVDDFGYSQEELAKKVGKDRTTITNSLRLLKLSPEIKAELSSGALTVGHARALLSVENMVLQRDIFNKVLQRGLSVRETEKLSKKSGKKGGALVNEKKVSSLGYLEDELRSTLGTKVQVKVKGKGGTIEIAFYSMAELDRIIELLRYSSR
jgi:ParB family chromosome partitioning protein